MKLAMAFHETGTWDLFMRAYIVTDDHSIVVQPEWVCDVRAGEIYLFEHSIDVSKTKIANNGPRKAYDSPFIVDAGEKHHAVGPRRIKRRITAIGVHEPVNYVVDLVP